MKPVEDAGLGGLRAVERDQRKADLPADARAAVEALDREAAQTADSTVASTDLDTVHAWHPLRLVKLNVGEEAGHPGWGPLGCVDLEPAGAGSAAASIRLSGRARTRCRTRLVLQPVGL